MMGLVKPQQRASFEPLRKYYRGTPTFLGFQAHFFMGVML